jgi:hypothetical protein
MDMQIQLKGLDQFLGSLYEGGASLETLLGSLGFDSGQRAALRQHHLATIADGLIEFLRKRLTWEDKDLWYRLLARRFGLDGEAPVSLEEAAAALNIDVPYASYAEGEALQKCRTKSSLEAFKRELHRLALEALSSSEKPGTDRVIQKLERLADLRAAADVARMDYEARRSEILKKVQTELDALEAEFSPVLEAAEDNAAALEAEIKNDVLLRGESLRGGGFQAVYMKGRVSWDAASMNEYARDHPDVLKFRKEGQPSVSLRPVSGGAVERQD